MPEIDKTKSVPIYRQLDDVAYLSDRMHQDDTVILEEGAELFFQVREAACLNFIQHVVRAAHICDVTSNGDLFRRVTFAVEGLQSLVQRTFVEGADTHGSALIQLRRAKSSVQIRGSW